jgi:acetoin utilization protein AcuB
MSAPVSTAREDEPVEAAIERMLKDDVHALPVLGAGDRLVGIVTDQDLLSAVAGPARAPGPPHGPLADDVMTREPATVEPDDTLGDAATLILQGGFRHVPVVDGTGRLLGLVSERDLRTKLGVDVSDFPDAALDALSEPVSESMTPDPITVELGTPLSEVVEAFAAERVGAIPVVDGEKLVGIISYLDVLKWLRDGKPLHG